MFQLDRFTVAAPPRARREPHSPSPQVLRAEPHHRDGDARTRRDAPNRVPSRRCVPPTVTCDDPGEAAGDSAALAVHQVVGAGGRSTSGTGSGRPRTSPRRRAAPAAGAGAGAQGTAFRQRPKTSRSRSLDADPAAARARPAASRPRGTLRAGSKAAPSITLTLPRRTVSRPRRTAFEVRAGDAPKEREAQHRRVLPCRPHCQGSPNSPRSRSPKHPRPSHRRRSGHARPR